MNTDSDVCKMNAAEEIQLYSLSDSDHMRCIITITWGISNKSPTFFNVSNWPLQNCQNEHYLPWPCCNNKTLH